MDRLYLAHHGIKGQKWGVRRFRNRDGSLTEAGKKRYLRSDGSLTDAGQREFFSSNGSLTDAGAQYYKSEGYELKNTSARGAYYRKSGDGYFVPSVAASGKEIEEVASRMASNAEELIGKQNDAYLSGCQCIKEIASQPEAHKDALALMKRELVSPDVVDDKDLIDLAAYDAAYDVVRNRAHTTESGRRVDAYDAAINKWYDDAKAETERLMSLRKDVPIGYAKNNKYTYKDVVYSTLASSAPEYLSYIARHGTWESVFDSDALDQFAESIAEEFMNS